MNSPASKPIQIFKPGRHTAMSGVALAFSESDLAASAAAYDPALFEAPLVVGHPKTDNPAYGWVKSLAFADGGLDAAPSQVDPAFAEMVSAGRFKKISAAFYAPTAPNNPVPGVYYLRHVGFLGAQAPAVKGLRTPEFAETEEGIVEFADWSDMQNASLWRRMRDHLINTLGLDKADSIVPDYAVASLEEEARKESPDEPISAPSFADPVIQPTQETSTVTPEQAAALAAENAQLKTQVADAEARDKAARVVVVHTGNTAFAEALVSAGKLLPIELAVTVAALDHFAAQETPVEFADGDVQKPLGESFKAFLGGLPKRIEFGEVVKGDLVAATVEFATPSGHSVDSETLEIHYKALAHQAAHPDTDYVSAVKAVS